MIQQEASGREQAREVFKEHARLRGHYLGGLIDAEHWFLLNALRQYAVRSPISARELHAFCSELGRTQVPTRMPGLKAKGFVEFTDDENGDVGEIQATRPFVDAFDDYLREFNVKLASLYLGLEEVKGVRNRFDRIARPYSAQLVTSLLGLWISGYRPIWRGMVQEAFNLYPRSEPREKLRSSFYKDEIHWAVLMSLCDHKPSPGDRDPHLEHNEILKEVAHYATPESPKLRKTLKKYLNVGVLVERKGRKGNAEGFRLQPEVHELVHAHLVAADDMFRRAAHRLLTLDT